MNEQRIGSTGKYLLPCNVKEMDAMKLQPHTTKENSPDEAVEILSTFNNADMAMIESVLRDNGIEYVLVGGNTHYDPLRVVVRAGQAGDALRIVKTMKLNFTRITYWWKGEAGKGTP